MTGVAVAALGGTGYWMLREQSSRKAAKRAIQSCGSNICVAFETQYHKMTAQYYKLAEANKLLKREIQSLMGAAREVESQAVVAVVDEKSDPKNLFLVLRAELDKAKQNLEDLEGQNRCLQSEVDELRASAELTEKGIAVERSNIQNTLELMREEHSRKDAESDAVMMEELSNNKKKLKLLREEHSRKDAETDAMILEELSNNKKTLKLMREEHSRKDAESDALTEELSNNKKTLELMREEHTRKETDSEIAEERSNIKKTLELMREENSRKDAESGALRQQNLKLAADVGRLQASLIHATKVLELHEKTPSSRKDSLLVVADAQSKHHDDSVSQMSEATNMSDVSNGDHMNGNKGKFEKMKQQRNLFREQLKHSTLELASLRKEVAALRDLQSKYYVA